MPDREKEYLDLKSAFADAMVDLNRAFTAYESFPRDEGGRFERLEKALGAVSYSLALLSFARRAYKKTLAKRGERS